MDNEYKHIFPRDIDVIKEKSAKLIAICQEINEKVAKVADDQVGKMLDDFFLDTDVSAYFSESDGIVIDITNNDYEISTTLDEAFEFLVNDADLSRNERTQVIAKLKEITTQLEHKK